MGDEDERKDGFQGTSCERDENGWGGQGPRGEGRRRGEASCRDERTIVADDDEKSDDRQGGKRKQRRCSKGSRGERARPPRRGSRVSGQRDLQICRSHLRNHARGLGLRVPSPEGGVDRREVSGERERLGTRARRAHPSSDRISENKNSFCFHFIV